MFTKTTCTTEDFVSCRDRVMGYDQRERISRMDVRKTKQNATFKDKMLQHKQARAAKQQDKKNASIKKASK